MSTDGTGLAARGQHGWTIRMIMRMVQHRSVTPVT
jgi:hypothetical protein